MIQVTINREPSTNYGTEGKLCATFGDMSFSCLTLELPSRQNERDFSSIPAGTYRCSVVRSYEYGDTYEVLNVPDRINILICSGNYAGDRRAGFRSETRGSILLGTHFDRFNNQTVVKHSGMALSAFLAFFGGKDFQLEINELAGEI
jgi:hypothetical protein